MTDKRFRGVYAAVLSPRLDDGTLDLASLRALIQFLRERGITRFAVNGATGEFCLTAPHELRELLAIVRAEGGPQTEILCGVGAAGIAGTQALTRVAEEAQVHGLLLSMPYFFPYSQEDLYTFSADVAASTQLPILLYNLPQFTSGLEPETACRLAETMPTIMGEKDSSGSLATLNALTTRVPQACRIVGNDSALAPALTEGVCDGVVSGVACILPELLTRLFHATPGSEDFQQRSLQLNEFIEQLNVFPTPWGLKIAAEARGVLQARFSLPLSEARVQQARAFQDWIHGWLPQMLASL